MTINKKKIFFLLTLIAISIIALVLTNKNIKNEEILGLKIGDPVSLALQMYPDFKCVKKNGYQCSVVVDDQALEINLNADELIYKIRSAVVVKDMTFHEVMSAARTEYANADFINDTYFYWYFNKDQTALKTISITQNFNYSWFCGFSDSSVHVVPNCGEKSVMIKKQLSDDTHFSLWFDKSSPDLQKLK